MSEQNDWDGFDVWDDGPPMAIIAPHSHVWINPNDPPIERAPYSPWLGPRRREMKADVPYHCRECAAVMKVKADV